MIVPEVEYILPWHQVFQRINNVQIMVTMTSEFPDRIIYCGYDNNFELIEVVEYKTGATE